MHFQGQAPPDAAQGGMVGHGFGGAELEELPQRQGIGTAPADAALGIDALEVADQEHAEIPARRDGPAAEFFGVEGRTELFEEAVKCFLVQELLQPLVKDMPLTLGQLIIDQPHALLLCLPPTRTHGRLLNTI